MLIITLTFVIRRANYEKKHRKKNLIKKFPNIMTEVLEKNDYQEAKAITTDLKLNKQKELIPNDIPTFRRYLSLVAMKADRKFITKIMGDKLLVIRVK